MPIKITNISRFVVIVGDRTFERNRTYELSDEFYEQHKATIDMLISSKALKREDIPDVVPEVVSERKEETVVEEIPSEMKIEEEKEEVEDLIDKPKRGRRSSRT